MILAGICLSAIFLKMLSVIMAAIHPQLLRFPVRACGKKGSDPFEFRGLTPFCHRLLQYPSLVNQATACGGESFMPWVMGIDEAGYGPNLGPFVMASVCCRVPEEHAQSCLWRLLKKVVRRNRQRD